jgi:acyl-CoA thioesterase YciA
MDDALPFLKPCRYNACGLSAEYQRSNPVRVLLSIVGWDATALLALLDIASMSNPYLAIQVVMMPRDTNPHGTIFGGVILSYIDQAAAIGARHEVISRGGPPPFVVTVAMNRVEFHKPVLVGDVVRFLTWPVRIGRTSITMHVNVEAERGLEVLHVTEAEVVYVGIDPNDPERRPTPLLPQAVPPGT